MAVDMHQEICYSAKTSARRLSFNEAFAEVLNQSPEEIEKEEIDFFISEAFETFMKMDAVARNANHKAKGFCNAGFFKQR